MAIHYWGEKDFDWNGLDTAIGYIALNLRKWGRVSVFDYKEKFGMARIYCCLGWRSLLSITHPGWHHYGPYPKWLVTFDIFVLSNIIPLLFNWIIVPYHKWLYRRLYANAVKKWPHLREEILYCADWHDLLKGI